MMTANDMPYKFLKSLFLKAVDEADPMRVVSAHLPTRPQGRLVIVGAGKASARMAEAAECHYGTCEGVVITRYGYARPCDRIEIIEASHPTPDAAGVMATSRILDLISDLGPDDLVVALISGGGSALLCAPCDGLALEDKVTFNQTLLNSGLAIGDMNVLRKQLSRVKGGQLAAAAYPAPLYALMISDVPGDDPADIASGPTVGDPRDPKAALARLEETGHQISPKVAAIFAQPGPVLAPEDPRLSKTTNCIIAAPSQSLEAARGMAEAAGCDVRMLGDALEGEARDLAASQIEFALSLQSQMTQESKPILLLSGGECTVTRRGDGIGGPNAEYVLSAALALAGAPGIHVLAGDTDGVDGAAEIAGAYAGPDTLAGRFQEARNALANNDAHRFFEACGTQLVTGPTLTNVNDFRAILITKP